MVTRQEVGEAREGLRRDEDAAMSQILDGLYPICILDLCSLLGVMDSVLMVLYSSRQCLDQG